jgi:putative DNA primase/helicase
MTNLARSTLQLAAEALSYIPPDVDRETWVRVGMALKAEFDEAGFDVWAKWSEASETFKATDARDTWRSIKAGGRVQIGTLFGLAKDHGFRFSRDRAAAAVPASDAADLVAARRHKQQLDEAHYRARADRAARVAVEMWGAASDEGESPYLHRKGVRGHGVRYQAGGALLVPMRDAAGELQNVQRIAAELPADGKDKHFLAGGRKSELWHQLGAIDGAAALLVAEGYATAASVHEASGLPVAVAFDAGNLGHVARALRALHPEMPILVCGDDDQATEARTGTNTGRKKAAAAARAVDGDSAPGRAVFPAGLALDQSDFNDMAATAGADAVRSVIEKAVAEIHAPAQRQPARSARSARKGAPEGDRGGKGADGAGAPPDKGAGNDDAGPPEWDAFFVDANGVWHTARDAEGNSKKPQWLCTRLDVTARTRADDANGWGYLLEFRDPDGNAKSWAMPSAMLSGDGSEWAGRLRDMGLRMAPGTQPRNLVAKYIDTRNPPERVTCTDRVGWHGPVFVLPSGTIGTAEGRRFVFQSESGMEDTFRRSGALADWHANVGALCVGNSRLAFSVCCALAGAMLRPAGMEGGGFHLRGNSSIGKTTGLRVAASVWGRPSYMQRWRTTDNALEATAVQHCDGLLILDEIAQIDGRVLGECAYMLANGQEKGRATRGGLSRKKRTWLNLFLSSGEISMADHMAEAGKRTRAGQEVRMLDVPLDAGRSMGGIEELHGFEGPAQLAEAIGKAAARYYGTAGRAWLEWAAAHHAGLAERLQVLVEQYLTQMVPEAASQQVRRAGNRFALVAAAGELATVAGITGWPEGESLRAVRQCFNAWLASRGHLDNGEDAAMMRQARQFLEAHGEGRFTWWHRAVDDHGPKTLNRAGFRRFLGPDGKPIKTNSDHQREYGERISAADSETAQIEFFVLREVFVHEMCRGFDPTAFAKLLQRRGHLKHDAGRLTSKPRLPGTGSTWCYHLKPSLFEDEL